MQLLSTLFLSSGDLIADRRYAWAQDLESKGDLAGAAELLEQALELTPGYASAWFALGELREKLGDTDGAAAAYCKAREADPEDRHGAVLNLMRLKAAEPSGMPPAYVRTLFDHYAPDFDRSLTDGLNYSAPRLLLAAAEAAARGAGRTMQFAAMLDLGCGTGLAGAAFRAKADRLVGVDLSPRMIEQARQKNIYDRLEVGDLLGFLAAEQGAGNRYELILAADVFAYLPDLAPVARAAAAVLTRGGLFAFSVESNDGEGVELGEALRFSHSAAHVRAALDGAGLKLLGLDSASTRTEKGWPVPALIAVAQSELPPPLRGRVGEGGVFDSCEEADPPPAALRASTSPARGEVKKEERIETRPLLPEPFEKWFAARGWAPRKHQLDLLAKAQAGRSALLIAPTGAGKTLAGFLPTLVELYEASPRMKEAPSSRQAAGRVGVGGLFAPSNIPPNPDPSPPFAGRMGGGERIRKLISTGREIRREGGLHTLYISPLKALAVDIARNLETPVAEMGLPIRLETRTGDTPGSKRQRQRRDPPDVLLTTPEQVALLLASADAPFLFGSLKRVVLDELHSLVTSKRGDLLSLGLARLFRLAPQLTSVGLSATVAEPDDLCRFLLPQPVDGEARADLVIAGGAAAPEVSMLDTKEHLPWAGHGARHALGEIYDLIKRHKTTLIFVNTRSQAEGLFQDLWRMNDDNLAIALHHGSLDVGQRRRVEDAMAEGKLRAVVCTSSLDLGVDWGDVDLVINVGAPKGSSRLMQRIGRANHRLDEPSRAVLIPANRFEVLECQAALGAVADDAQDTPPARTGALDVLAQHVLGCAVGEPFRSDDLYNEIRAAAPYATLTRTDFDDVVDFVATGGYALKAYERFAKIRQGQDGRWRITHPRIAQRYRMNVGTIVEADMLKVRLVRSRAAKTAIPRGGRLLGQVEEYFIETLALGDTFVFAGEILRYETLVEDEVYVSRAADEDPKVPAYEGGKFPLSTYLAARVRDLIADHHAWRALPEQVREWLEIQEWRSLLPPAGDLLVETFPRASKHHLVCYPFEGRLAHQTLGMLLTRRLERARLRPLGFVANEYALAVWTLGDIGQAIDDGRLSLAALFDEDMLGDDLEAWLAESALMKRTFRTCAIIAGLIERRFPGEEKSRRQVTISTDLVYDVLRKHQPDHVLLRAGRADAATGLLDIRRLGTMLARIRGRIIHKALDRVSPLAVPVMLEIGRESVYGEASDVLLAEAEQELIREAMG